MQTTLIVILMVVLRLLPFALVLLVGVIAERRQEVH